MNKTVCDFCGKKVDADKVVYVANWKILCLKKKCVEKYGARVFAMLEKMDEIKKILDRTQ